MKLPLLLLCLISCVQSKITIRIPLAQDGEQVLGGDNDLFGYNILTGCPLTSGRDPGFTRPIFSTTGHVTQDFRYSMPSELIVSKDVSCDAVFASTVVKTPYELTKLLTRTAQVYSHQWGPPFSANQHFRKLLSDLKQNILVVSTAVCSLYDVTFHDQLPSFHPSFLEWVLMLNNSNNEEIYLAFLHTYGTHFVYRARFGASVTVVHKINDQMYGRYTHELVRSYASHYSAALFGFDETLSDHHYDVTPEFKDDLETTTFSVGVPLPYKGNSLTWLTAVKDNPNPIDYELNTIEALFSDTLMGNESSLQSYHIDYATIQNNIMAVKTKYCQTFRTANLLDDCQATSGLTLISTKLIGSSTPRAVANPDQCNEECYQLPACVAVTICPGCDIGNVSNHCQMFSSVEIQSAMTDRMWKTKLFVNKMETVVRLQDTTVVVNRYSKTDIPTITSIDDCYPPCIEDAKCFAFTMFKVPESTIKCTRHTGSLLSLTQGTGVSVYFVSPLVKRLIRSQQTKGLVTSTMKNDWYDAVCVINNECRQNNSMCFLNRCLCRPGFFFSPRDKTCSDIWVIELKTVYIELKRNMGY
ncbi:hypothetical protein C0Q70_12017 [Pomacea canaliculata]|uniref:MACPF domain-containing protein n=1 Tax=Pomacea canaliculata TaxID=400727 RepID=A0A2T7P0E5_POMCA|nr:hypothetical protein C0Q70_12017 [Pomacea canaliculata]